MKTALYTDSCRLCDHQGWLCFTVFDTGEMMLVCDECDALWASPADLQNGEPLLSRSPLKARWATREEIEARGWGASIAGEHSYHVDKSGARISDEKAEAEARKRLGRGPARE